MTRKVFENMLQLWKIIVDLEILINRILSVCAICWHESSVIFIEVLFINLFTNESYKFLNCISVLIYIFAAIYGMKTLHYLSIWKKLTLIDLILLFVPRGKRNKKKDFRMRYGLFVIYQASKGEYFIKGFLANLKTTLKICLEVLIDVPRAHLNG